MEHRSTPMPEGSPPPARVHATGIRLVAFIGLVLAAAFGLASRQPPLVGWPVVGAYGGDAAWAMAAYAGWRIVRPASSIATIAGLALLTAFSVEFSQLLRVEWLDSMRSTRLGALLLGRGFLWSDLLAYAIGTGIASSIDTALRQAATHRAR